MNLFDTHAHLDDERFSGDLEAVLDRARRAGVRRILTIGTDVESSRKAVSLAEAGPGFIYASVAVHPHDAAEFEEADLDELRLLAQRECVVAVGETGLDYHYDNSPRDAQRRVFERHISLAIETDLPIVVHCREAFGDCLTILRSFRDPRLRGVAHCFGGSVETAHEFISLGFLISFAGPLTFPNARRLRETAAALPMESIVIETDCPYLAPQPVRGSRNEPAYVAHVAAALADLRGEDIEHIASLTTDNAIRLFSIPTGPESAQFPH